MAEMKSIFIVEDDVITATELKSKLQSMGYVVAGTAGSGEEAVTKILNSKPDLVLMDIHLKGRMNGIDVSQKVKEIDEIPIIFLTAYSDSDTLEKAKLIQPSAYLIKPFDSDELYTTIEISYHRFQMERRLEKAKDALERTVEERTSDLREANRKLRKEIEKRTQTQKKIEDLKLFNENIVQTVTAGIVMDDKDGILTFVNPTAASLLGYDPDELTGKHWNVTVPDDQRRIVEDANRRRKMGERDRYVLEFQRKNGDRVPVLVSGAPCMIENRWSGTLSVFTDISEQKRIQRALSESEMKYRALFNHIADPVVIYERYKFRLLDYNEAVPRIYGYSIDELKTMTLYDLQEGTRQKNSRKRKRIKKKVLYNEVHIANDGRRMDVEICSDEIEYQGRPAWISIIRDVTKRRQADEELKTYREHLEELVEERTAELQEMNRVLQLEISERKKAQEELHSYAEELRIAKVSEERNAAYLKQVVDDLEIAKSRAEEVTRLKGEFLANMSHEIRTPLNGIIGLTSLTLDTEMTSDQREYLKMVKTSADSLLNIVNDILDYSKIESGNLQIESIGFNIHASLEEVVQNMSYFAGEKRLELILDIDDDVIPNVIGDPNRLRQILINLVNNALKFTDKGEVLIRVSVGTQSDDVSVIHFTVIDTGMGVPPNKQDLIFEDFRQLDGSTTRKYGGTGLGLSISRKLVENMGGEIWLESPVKLNHSARSRKGSAFHFTLPFRVQEDQKTGSPEFRSELLSGIPVFVVDDNQSTLLCIVKILTSWGMKPKPFTSLKKVMTELQKYQMDKKLPLLLIDSGLPGMNGLEFLRKIEKSASFNLLCILMLSPSVRSDGLNRIQENRIPLYVMKPIVRSILHDVMVNALEKGHNINLESGENVDVQQQESEQEKSQKRRQSRILITEDNKISRTTVELYLKKKGWLVKSVENGEEACKAVQSEDFDLILMDVQMPVMDGLAATKKIREQERKSGRHIPIVAMTAHAMQGDRDKCLRAGMDDYVAKPIAAEKLFSVIEKHLHDEDSEEESVTAMNELRKSLKADDEDLMELKELIVNELPSQIERLRQSIDQKNIESVTKMAHSLKGAFGYIGANHAYELAKKIEISADMCDGTDVNKMIAELKIMSDRICTELQN